MNPDLIPFLKHLITCEPAEVQHNLLVFSDWLKEQGDERGDLVAKIAHKGPVEVEPARPVIARIGTVRYEFAGYNRRFSCKCGEVVFATPDTQIGHCQYCRQAWWMPGIKADEAANEMLNRLRVRCLVLFREEFINNGLLARFDTAGQQSTFVPTCDPRWPPLPCPRCDTTMTRCERCGAEWCNFCENFKRKTGLRCAECNHHPTISEVAPL